jgi:hypothetical protein
MPYFSKLSKDRLDTCECDLKNIFNQLIETYDFSVLCGFRDQDEQETAFKNGTTKAHFPNSKHNSYPSRAIDIAPYWQGAPHIRWGSLDEYTKYTELKKQYQTYSEYNNACMIAFSLLAGQAKAIAKEMNIPLIWGGDFKSLVDMPHFEIDRD